MTSETGAHILRTLEKGLQLLSLFNVDHQTWSARELREATGESKTTVLRLTKTLESVGYLARDPQSGRFRLGTSVAKLAYVNLSHIELVRVAAPFMRELSRQTNETVDIMVEIDDHSVMSIHEVTPRFLPSPSNVGKILDLGLSTAGTKVFAAFRPEESWDVALARSVRPFTERTITDPAVLRKQLVKVREEGVAFELGEWSAELGAVGAPVFGADGRVRAALSVVSPVERFGPEQMAFHAHAARETAAELSRALGASIEKVAFLKNRARSENGIRGYNGARVD